VTKEYYKDRYQRNKEKILERQKKYYVKNKDKILEKAKEYYIQSKDKILEKAKEYYIQNKSKKRGYEARKYKEDEQFKLAHLLRRRLRISIKEKNETISAVRLLSCTIKEVCIYIENRFQEGMNWNNWSVHGWHIDHITPLSSFNLIDPEQAAKACHYTNLQPMWAKDNLSKGSK